MTLNHTCELPEGTAIGRYRMEGRLREGGMGSLYLGHHIETGARVAIKVQHANLAKVPQMSARFIRETRVLGALSGCPHIVAVQDAGQLDDGRRYLVMDFVRGQDLGDLLAELRSRDEPVQVGRALAWFRDIALALDAVHRAGVVHRDIKPSNIMIEQARGGHEAAKLIDFGVSADLHARREGQDLTAQGVAVGTEPYLAPEQRLGLSAHPSADIYGLGVVMRETLLAGCSRGRDLSPALRRLIDACTHADSTQRPSTQDIAQFMIAELEAMASGSHAIVVDASTRRWLRIVGITSAALMLGLALGWWVARPQTVFAQAALATWSWHPPQSIAAMANEPPLPRAVEPAPVPVPRQAVAAASVRPPAPPMPARPPTPAPADEPTPSPCATHVADAHQAMHERRWQAVVRHTEHISCFPSAVERLKLRLGALIELQRYDACVHDAGPFPPTDIVPYVRFCRHRSKLSP